MICPKHREINLARSNALSYNANSLTATYTPGNNDIENGFVELTLTVFCNNNCLVDNTDMMNLIVQKSPELPILHEGPNVVDHDLVNKSEYIVPSVGNAKYYY